MIHLTPGRSLPSARMYPSRYPAESWLARQQLASLAPIRWHPSRLQRRRLQARCVLASGWYRLRQIVCCGAILTVWLGSLRLPRRAVLDGSLPAKSANGGEPGVVGHAAFANVESNVKHETRYVMRCLTFNGQQALVARKVLTLHCAIPSATSHRQRSGRVSSGAWAGMCTA